MKLIYKSRERENPINKPQDNSLLAKYHNFYKTAQERRNERRKTYEDEELGIWY